MVLVPMVMVDPTLVPVIASWNADKNITTSGSVDLSFSSGGTQSGLPFPDRPLWRDQYCELLNEDFSVFGRVLIQVCLPNEACDDSVLGDSDVGVMFVSDHDQLQMTTCRSTGQAIPLLYPPKPS